jgi:hypothetical protein
MRSNCTAVALAEGGERDDKEREEREGEKEERARFIFCIGEDQKFKNIPMHFILLSRPSFSLSLSVNFFNVLIDCKFKACRMSKT